LFLRCGIGGILGGFALMLYPDLNMFWRGLTLLTVGCLSMVLWWTGIGLLRSGGKRKTAEGPIFEPADPDASGDAATTNLVREIRRERVRHKRGSD
jgi:hypothetical protein